MSKKKYLTREQLTPVLRQFVGNPAYESHRRDDLFKIPAGSYINYVIASRSKKGGPTMYKMGTGFYKNNYFDNEKNRYIMWIFNKHINKNVRIYHENIRYVFVKIKMEKKIVDRLEAIESAIESSTESERDHTVTIMKAILTVGRAAKEH